MPSSDYYPALLHDDGLVSHTHFIQTTWIAAILLCVRYVSELTILKWLRKRMEGVKGGREKASTIFDNGYIVLWSIGTEMLAIYVTLNINGGCKPWSTDACLTGWPNHPVHLLQKLYMILMFQFYLHEMVGALFGVGPKIKQDMVIHHFATMGLISSAYCLNLNRYGIMWQALFDTSNPLLHAAKGLNAAGIPQLEGIKWALFNSFALVFFVCRVAAAPFSILYPSLTRAFDVLPSGWAALLLLLMAVVCGMQWIWFMKIVQLARGQGSKDGDSKEGEGEKPPAKKEQ